MVRCFRVYSQCMPLTPPRVPPRPPSHPLGGIRSAKSDVASSLARLSESVSLVERHTSQECAKLEKVYLNKQDTSPAQTCLCYRSPVELRHPPPYSTCAVFVQVLQAEIMSRQSGQEKLKTSTTDLGERLTALQQRLNSQAEELSGAIRAAQTTIKAEVAKNLGENNDSLRR